MVPQKQTEVKIRFEIRGEPTSGQEFGHWAQLIVGLIEDKGKFISPGAHIVFYYSGATNWFWSIPGGHSSLFPYYSENALK